MLRHLLVRGSLVGVDGLHELEVGGIDVGASERDDVLGDGGGEKEGLAGPLLGVGQQLDNLV